MTNMYRKKHTGAALLVITVILLLAALLGMFFAASHSVLQGKSAANQYRNNQAYQAAQAGLEFGLVYLSQNASTITGSPSGGYINYGPSDTNITNVTLANNSKYSIVYTNPTQNNYNRLTITSTGTSADGTSIETIREQVSQSYSGMSTVSLKGNLVVNGQGGGITGTSAILAGGNVDTSAVSGGGTLIANDTSIASMSNNAFFTSILGNSKATQQSQSTYYANAASVPWGSLSGSVWVNGNVSIAGNTTVGTVANPVTLIVNGNYFITGNAIVNGLVYVMGDADLSGNGTINGFMVSEGNSIFSGNGTVNFNPTIANTLLINGSIVGDYTKIPGSWKDY